MQLSTHALPGRKLAVKAAREGVSRNALISKVLAEKMSR